MTDHDDFTTEPRQTEEEEQKPRFPELAELEEKISRRLRSNQRFLERVLDEDFDALDDFDDEDPDLDDVEDEVDGEEEL